MGTYTKGTTKAVHGGREPREHGPTIYHPRPPKVITCSKRISKREYRKIHSKGGK